ncbi:HD domain-containing protein [Streptomyces sp. V2I9]|uniref:HD domain-containing protein n=1 Tax=Streptomyces sp. V2I9 TaxID=3042304 RepID=UPI00277D2FC4|nr:HD domain-containing protein [Streptomyces sp. V2I9]MDQ0984425.1 (p)ppGpp synthase/HD superfamily hydrolase [Streptomyces sp. V2I9]
MTGPQLSVSAVEAIAREAHAHRTDKAGRPYEEHLAAVAEGVRVRGGDDGQIAAAWLHDAIEDGALSAAWLTGAPLPQRVKDMVLAVTKRPGEALTSYAARILATPGALLVKEADLAHNADPARLAVLDAATRTRLAAKYAQVRGLLGLPGGELPLDRKNSANPETR